MLSSQVEVGMVVVEKKQEWRAQPTQWVVQKAEEVAKGRSSNAKTTRLTCTATFGGEVKERKMKVHEVDTVEEWETARRYFLEREEYKRKKAEEAVNVRESNQVLLERLLGKPSTGNTYSGTRAMENGVFLTTEDLRNLVETLKSA